MLLYILLREVSNNNGDLVHCCIINKNKANERIKVKITIRSSFCVQFYSFFCYDKSYHEFFISPAIKTKRTRENHFFIPVKFRSAQKRQVEKSVIDFPMPFTAVFIVISEPTLYERNQSDVTVWFLRKLDPFSVLTVLSLGRTDSLGLELEGFRLIHKSFVPKF